MLTNPVGIFVLLLDTGPFETLNLTHLNPPFRIGKRLARDRKLYDPSHSLDLLEQRHLKEKQVCRQSSSHQCFLQASLRGEGERGDPPRKILNNTKVKVKWDSFLTLKQLNLSYT